MTERKRKSLRRKLQESRYRLLTRAPELAYPMLKMLFVATKDVYRISTNGSCIYFDAAWLDKLPEWSLDYALCHQMMHIRLDHLSRPRLYKGKRFHYACNIIVNSHLVDYGFIEEKLPGIGELQRETLFPVVPGNAVTPLEAFGMCPFDPAVLSGGQRSRIVPDTDAWWDRPDDRGQDGVIVLSPDDPDPEDLIPSARISGEIERYLIPWATLKMPLRNISIETKETDDLDDFTTEYVTGPNMSLKETVSDLRSLKAREETEHSDDMRERVIREICVMAKDWRTLLSHFIMDETRDYDFTPPDKRMQDTDFFLLDFNEAAVPRLRVLFMIDISGSLRDEEVSMAVEELNAAVEQFGGMLQGTVGFFDTKVRRVYPLQKFTRLAELVPANGGGTDFGCIFEYVRREMPEELPSEIVIMTDGKADFPDYSETMGIPVLWLLTSDRIRIPWGQATYFRRQ